MVILAIYRHENGRNTAAIFIVGIFYAFIYVREKSGNIIKSDDFCDTDAFIPHFFNGIDKSFQATKVIYLSIKVNLHRGMQ